MIQIIENADDNSFIKQRKSMVLKKFKNTRSETIDEATELAVYLYAIGKADEAERLLSSFCETSPYVESRPQRWMAVGQAILFNAYIKGLNSKKVESDKLTLLILEKDYNPIPTSKLEYLGRLLEGKSTELELIEQESKLQNCKTLAQLFLLFIYAKQMQPHYQKEFGREAEQTIESNLKELSGLLKAKIIGNS